MFLAWLHLNTFWFLLSRSNCPSPFRLIRSRSESELATLMTQIKKLKVCIIMSTNHVFNHILALKLVHLFAGIGGRVGEEQRVQSASL